MPHSRAREGFAQLRKTATVTRAHRAGPSPTQTPTDRTDGTRAHGMSPGQNMLRHGTRHHRQRGHGTSVEHRAHIKPFSASRRAHGDGVLFVTTRHW